MPFDLSQTKPLLVQPWRYTTQPTYNPDGSILTPGVKQTPNGVFIMLSDTLVDYMRETLTDAEKTEIAPWVNRYTEAQAATWNVSMWSGEKSAVYLRVPSTIWNDPTTPPPLKVKRYLRNLFRD